MPHHVVVDGSNLATEGRAMPSLAQLNDAVMAFIDEHPDALITVVVDATFGHRIDPSEVKEFDAAVSNNELVAPPAGAIGRGDAFVLSIANKVGATILSNDSFQEFHGTYPWLFDEGRLVGGKPVPHIGWVFVNRVPVRGPVSRTAVKEARRKKSGVAAGATAPAAAPAKGGKRHVSPEANQPMPVPKAPPPGAVLKAPARAAAPHPAHVPDGAAPTPAAAPKATAVNDLLPFLSFVEHHPLGTSVNATVESYSSHGAYVRLDGDVMGYLPLRKMAEPAPRSAREFLTIGDTITLVVESFAPTRRSIDLATVAMATVTAPEVVEKPAKRTRAKKAAPPAETVAAADTAATPAEAAPDEQAVPAKPGRAAKASKAAKATKAAKPAATEPAPKAPAAKTGAASKAAAKAPATKPGRSAKAAAAAATPAAEAATAPAAPAEAAPPRGRAKRSAAAAPVVAEPVADTAAAPAKRATKQATKQGAAKRASSAVPASDAVEAPAPAPAARPARAPRASKSAPAAPAAADPAPADAPAAEAAPARRRRPRA